MAEERDVTLARVTDDAGDADSTKAELQRRMDEARESISQTVTEIKDTVVNQYQQVRETISDTLDWREQYRRHTLPMTVGAGAVGFIVGYAVMGAFKSDGDDYEGEQDYAAEGATRSYAATPILGQAHAPAAYQRASAPGSNAPTEAGGTESFGAGGADSVSASRPSYSSGYQAATAPQASHADDAGGQEEEEEKGPGLLARFKETKAYDRLTDELSTLGERAVEELSRTAQTVVLPMLLSKIKGLVGLDLSTQQRGSSGQQGARAQSGASSSAPSGATGQGASSGTPGAEGAGDSSAYTAVSGTGRS